MRRRKVILDVDPGIDDAVALCMALLDERIELVAVTSVGGTVSPDQANRNLQAIIGSIDPPKWPRLGAATASEQAPRTDGRSLHGADGLGNSNLGCARLIHPPAADKMICDEVHAAPGEISLVATGPLTNLARAFARDPELPDLLDRVILAGGADHGPGDATATAEFNFYCDPEAARNVLGISADATIIPIDASSQVQFTFNLLDELPSADQSVGALLRRVLPHFFRSYRHHFGVESIPLQAAVATAAVTHPELFEIEPIGCDVETSGELTTGQLVVDRRSEPRMRGNAHICSRVDAGAVQDCIIRALHGAALS